MKNANSNTRLLAFLATVAIVLTLIGPALAVDDGARTYWKAREGTNIVSFQSLRWDITTSDTQQFDPGQFIYPNADVEASLFMATYSRHFTWLNRPSSFTFTAAGGNVDADIGSSLPAPFLPPGIVPGTSFSQSSSGFADPAAQLVVNLFGTPPLKSNVDLLNYEPTWTLDAATMLAFPIGEYDDEKLVNIGQNRWFGRFGLPFKYHFGPFAPGHMTSLEITPSVWLFNKNDDFVGRTLENDPLWQLEAHLTRDFTESFMGSLDLLYRTGFQSEIDGVVAGDDLDVGNLGFTLQYQLADNVALRTSYSTNVFGDSDLDNSMIRIGIVYPWHRSTENAKKLNRGH